MIMVSIGSIFEWGAILFAAGVATGVFGVVYAYEKWRHRKNKKVAASEV